MQKNIHRDGPPQGLYACASRDSHGQFGVLLAQGDLKLLFIEESKLDVYLAAVSARPDMDAEITQLIRDAALTLPRFKLTYRAVQSAERN